MSTTTRVEISVNCKCGQLMTMVEDRREDCQCQAVLPNSMEFVCSSCGWFVDLCWREGSLIPER